VSRPANRKPVAAPIAESNIETQAESLSWRYMHTFGVSINGAPSRANSLDECYTPMVLLFCGGDRCNARVGYVEVYDPRPRGQSLFTVARLQYPHDLDARPVEMRIVAVVLDELTPPVLATYCAAHGELVAARDALLNTEREAFRLFEAAGVEGRATMKARKLTLPLA